ncbi:Endoplasmic reticulum zinc transporter [Maudiozyma exigua]|uniref:Endoplasmic reticulum zinc transporter n=1 Tax=Maudiozyma exigua TaxID=34358 RepID=A0A9P7BBB8_MAUEX|nr:Endoplasmic reticulum zinc transporter [Kazachstania exigua]
MEGPKDKQLHSSNSTPVMNAIEEEEDMPPTPIEPPTNEFKTPYLNNETFNLSSTDLFHTAKANYPNSQTQTKFMSPPVASFYSAKDGNNSSSSLIYNSGFTFGGNNNGDNTPTANTPTKNGAAPVGAQYKREPRRNSLKYVPGSKLAPPPTSRTRSPIRNASPEMIPTSKRSSTYLESPFNFTQGHHEPPKTIITSPNKSTPPNSAGSRASFRKGHRYKHSSVSMNFFQEAEVMIPLNIAKSLPIPDFSDIFQNLPWPKAHLQLSIVFSQLITGIAIFLIGNSKSWTNFITLSHFITYDIIGSLVIIFIETLSQFEAWFTGTITFPFGLNRVDVLLSFALAVSLCFVGLDLLFHMLEEFIAFFVEASKPEHHGDIASQIPHSHHDGITSSQLLSGNDLTLWYIMIIINLVLAIFSLYKIFYANTNSKLKTKNPIITMIYTCYLIIFPCLSDNLSNISDYIASFMISMFIMVHGLTIAEWTSTILLLGFSTTALPTSAFLLDQSNNQLEEVNSHNEKLNVSDKLNSVIRGRRRSSSSLPVATSKKNSIHYDDTILTSFLSFFKSGKCSNRQNFSSPTNIKSIIKEQIENLPEFKLRCHLSHNNLVIIKTNFNLFVVLLKIDLKGGSNDDENGLRIAVDKCVKKYLPNSETTIEIDRI